jgi:hypothetical protein
MPHDCPKWTGRHAVQTPPAAAHIQKRVLVTLKAAKGIPPTHITSQAFPASPAQVIVYL